MPVRVLFFASLRELLGCEVCEIEVEPGLTVAGVWERAAPGQVRDGRVLAAVNQDYAGPDAPVEEGDEVAFFPPVTGG